MTALISLPVLVFALVVQTAIFSRITLLSGCADLLLLLIAGWGLQPNARHVWVWAGLAGLLVGYVSVLPMAIPVISYLVTMGLARLLQRRIWQAPLLVMFVITFIGSLLMQFLSYLSFWFQGNPLSLDTAFLQVILPSLLLNLLLSIPCHALMRDLANWIHPLEIEE